MIIETISEAVIVLFAATSCLLYLVSLRSSVLRKRLECQAKKMADKYSKLEKERAGLAESLAECLDKMPSRGPGGQFVSKSDD